MIIVDASVAIKWIISDKEESRDKALELLQNHLDGKETISVLSLLYLEIANVLVTQTKMPNEAIRESLHFLNDLNLKIYSFTKADYIDASILAKKYKTDVYEMLYAVAARKIKTILVTADEGFIKKTGFRYVRHLRELF